MRARVYAFLSHGSRPFRAAQVDIYVVVCERLVPSLVRRSLVSHKAAEKIRNTVRKPRCIAVCFVFFFSYPFKFATMCIFILPGPTLCRTFVMDTSDLVANSRPRKSVIQQSVTVDSMRSVVYNRLLCFTFNAVACFVVRAFLSPMQVSSRRRRCIR